LTVEIRKIAVNIRFDHVDPRGEAALSLLRKAAVEVLYEAFGFRRIEPSGQYESHPTSVCFELAIGDV